MERQEILNRYVFNFFKLVLAVTISFVIFVIVEVITVGFGLLISLFIGLCLLACI